MIREDFDKFDDWDDEDEYIEAEHEEVFEDDDGKMNINPKDAGAKILIVSQFTLYADCASRRPGFFDAARPEISVPL